ncbi:MAG: sulfatase [Planctomycetota bacterium]|nr:sulfatase [Planctomycetota bacterium]
MVIVSSALATFHLLLVQSVPSPADPPCNVVIVFTDDQGWGDLGCQGSVEIPTPNIDRLAAEGIRFTDFYVSQPVCSASRASLLTGCYANRIGIAGALGPSSRVGLDAGEVTIAEVLRPRGYATACLGKWHLGHHPEFLPVRHGFDLYSGIPYSNDMWPLHPESPDAWPPLSWYRIRSGARDPVLEPIDDLGDQDLITRRITREAVAFIRDHADRPFFLLIAHPMPHVPLGIAPEFRQTTRYGPYGDVIRELDWSVGVVREALEEVGVLDRTLVIYTSDNGPWLSYGDHAGSTGGLREGKGTTFEGGVRVPMVARLPGVIPPGTTTAEPCMTIDLLPTIAELTGSEAHLGSRVIDGRSLLPLLRDEPGASSPHEALFFWYGNGSLEAMRSGRWKLHFPHGYRSMEGRAPGNNGIPGRYDYGRRIGLELFDLESDPGETTDLASAHPEVVQRLSALAETARAELGDRARELRGTGARPPGRVEP